MRYFIKGGRGELKARTAHLFIFFEKFLILHNITKPTRVMKQTEKEPMLYGLDVPEFLIVVAILSLVSAVFNWGIVTTLWIYALIVFTKIAFLLCEIRTLLKKVNSKIESNSKE